MFTGATLQQGQIKRLIQRLIQRLIHCYWLTPLGCYQFVAEPLTTKMLSLFSHLQCSLPQKTVDFQCLHLVAGLRTAALATRVYICLVRDGSDYMLRNS